MLSFAQKYRLKYLFYYSIFSESQLLKIIEKQRGTIVLMYHNISDSHNFFDISFEEFQQHIKCLSRVVKWISLKEITKTIEKDHRPRAVITFDDAYSNLLDKALPFCAEKNIIPTLFVTPAFLQLHYKSYVTEQDIQTLLKKNKVQIGSHGFSHTPLDALKESDIKTELENSKRFLEDLTGISVDTLAWPHGAFSDKSINIAKMFYETAYAATPLHKYTCYSLPRITVSKQFANPSLFLSAVAAATAIPDEIFPLRLKRESPK